MHRLALLILLAATAPAAAETIRLDDAGLAARRPSDGRFLFDAAGPGPETGARAAVIVVRGGTDPAVAEDPTFAMARWLAGLCRSAPGETLATIDAILLPLLASY